MIPETVDENLKSAETADETMEETRDDTQGETVDETADEEYGISSGAVLSGKKKRSREPAVRAKRQIEARYLKIMGRELLPYVILVLCVGLLTGILLAARQIQTERIGREIMQEYEERFLDE